MIIETVAQKNLVVCPYCGGEYEATSFPVVNACTTPKIAMRVIERKFLVTCLHCEKKSLLIHPMYYFDVERNIALVYSRYCNQAKKMAKDIVPVPIGKNGKPIKIKTYSEWCDYNLAMCEYYGSAERRAKKAQKQPKNAGDLTVQTNTRLWQS